MPNRLEEIEKLGKVIADSDYFGEQNDEFMLAQDILDAGIGDKKQAVKEAFEELQKFCANADIVGVNGNVIMLDEIIDGIITELYGAGE